MLLCAKQILFFSVELSKASLYVDRVLPSFSTQGIAMWCMQTQRALDTPSGNAEPKQTAIEQLLAGEAQTAAEAAAKKVKKQRQKAQKQQQQQPVKQQPVDQTRSGQHQHWQAGQLQPHQEVAHMLRVNTDLQQSCSRKPARTAVPLTGLQTAE